MSVSQVSDWKYNRIAEMQCALNIFWKFLALLGLILCPPNCIGCSEVSGMDTKVCYWNLKYFSLARELLKILYPWLVLNLVLQSPKNLLDVYQVGTSIIIFIYFWYLYKIYVLLAFFPPSCIKWEGLKFFTTKCQLVHLDKIASITEVLPLF